MQYSDSLIDLLHRTANRAPSRDALVSPEKVVSYGELSTLVNKGTRILEAQGVTHSSVVGVRSASDTEHLLIYLASMQLGAATFTVPTQEVEFDFGEYEAGFDSLYIVNHLDFERVNESEDYRPHPDSNLLFSTSGTSGKPKVVVHTSTGLVAQAPRHVDSEEERFACIASVEHNFSRRHRLYVLARGATNVFLTGQAEISKDCRDLRVDTLHVSEYQARALIGNTQRGDLAGISLKIGGSHVAPDVRKFLAEELTPDIRFGYGTTETGAIAFAKANDFSDSESVGPPLAGLVAECRDESGSVVPVGEPGTLFVKGEGMFTAYMGREQLYAQTMIDGWYCTGDIAKVDENQNIFVLGRLDDMFVFNSINIYPQELESIILKHPAVADAAVVAKDSSVHGKVPIAFVVFDDYLKPPKIARLKRYVSERAGLRCPRQFIVVDSIPRGTTGKIKREAIQEIRGQIGDVKAQLCAAIKDLPPVFDLLGDELEGFESGESDIKLRKLGMDSITQMELLILVETEFDVVISPGEFANYRFLSQLVGRIAGRSSSDGNAPSQIPENFDSRYLDDTKRDYHKPAAVLTRVVRSSSSVGQLNKALQTFEHRLAPDELAHIVRLYSREQLRLIGDAKLNRAVGHWLSRMSNMLLSVGDRPYQSYRSTKLAPTVTFYDGGGNSAEKALIVCFATRGGRRLVVPNFVLLQCADAARVNFLVVAEPLGQNYSRGVPSLGNNELEVISGLKKLGVLQKHKEIRTMGCSAGAYMAILAGLRFRATLVLSVGGRFPRFKKQKASALWKALLLFVEKVRGGRSKALLSYSSSNKRDKKFARLISRVVTNEQVPIASSKGEVGHRALDALLEYGELEDFLGDTILKDQSRA